MRICHVITRLIIGGAQENTLLTCEGLHDKGHDVLLLAGPDTGPEGSLWDRASNYGYHTMLVPSMHRAIRPICDLKAIGELRRAYVEFKPDIIHTHSSKAGILGRFAVEADSGAGVVHTIHGMSFNRTQPALLRTFYAQLERQAAENTDTFVSVAQAMTDQAVAAGMATADKFVTVRSGMQTARFEPDSKKREATRNAWGVDQDHIVVGTVARLFRDKGYEQLIPAMALAFEKEDRLRFVWIGDGAQRDDYEGELSRLGLRRHVTLTGLLPPEHVAEQMQGFDLLAHPSQWEGLPRTVVQAQLLEVPPVCFDIDGTSEVVIDHKTGRLVPLNDIDAFSAAILQLATDPQIRLKMGRAGREQCLTAFDHRTMVDELEALYRKLRSMSN